MPSFDIVSEVDTQEIDNALNQARKDLATRFDLKDAKTEIIPEQTNKIILVRRRWCALEGASRNRHREAVKARRGFAECRAGRTRDLIRRSCQAGIEDQARPRREQSQRNYSGDQIPGVQSPKPAAGPANSRHREKERRPASRHSVRAQSRLRCCDKLQKFQGLNNVSESCLCAFGPVGELLLRLTSRISDPARVMLGMERRRYRGVRCIRFVKRRAALASTVHSNSNSNARERARPSIPGKSVALLMFML